jgi:putative acetyltransferase
MVTDRRSRGTSAVLCPCYRRPVGNPSILVRRAEPGDYAAVHRTFSSPLAMAGTLQLPYPSAEVWRKRMAEPASDAHILVAEVDGEVVGNLGLHYDHKSQRRRHVGSLGMAVRDDWQKKGVGTALMRAAIDLADNWINLQRLELTVFVDNAPAIALYGKFGFVIEGTHRLYAFRDGAYVDAHTMARLRASRDSAKTGPAAD